MPVGEWYTAELDLGFPTQQVRARFGPVGRDFFLKREGYAIAIRGDTLYLWDSTTRGPINAAYALLEEE